MEVDNNNFAELTLEVDNIIQTTNAHELKCIIEMIEAGELEPQHVKMTPVVKEKFKAAYEIKSKLEQAAEYQFERYCVGYVGEGVVEMLKKYGVAIVPSVLSDQECVEMVDGMWKTIEHITSLMEKPVKRNDPETWTSFFNLGVLHSMLMQHWQIGHAQFVWNLRQNPKLVAIFAKIWNVTPEELLVSFDGVAFNPPHETTKRGYFRDNNWLHSDQNLFESEFCCVQSWVTGLDVRDGDATLTFLEGSNQLHEEFAKSKTTKTKKDWVKLEDDDVKWFLDRGCVKRSIICPKGSLVLWDSRTFHSGKEPLKSRAAPNFRCVVYLCYTPRSLISKANLKKKVTAFNEMRMTSHWPHKVKLFPLEPRTYPGQNLPTVRNLPRPELNELGKKLSGQ